MVNGTAEAVPYKTKRSLTHASSPKLRRQVKHAGGGDVKFAWLRSVRFATGTAFVGPVNRPRTQAAVVCGMEIAGVGGHHHGFFRLEAQQVDRSQIHLAVGFVVLR